MQITVDLPEDIARTLAADPQSLSRTTLEALALEGVRSGKLSTGQVGRLLGFSTRIAADGFLKDHGVDLPLTVEDVEREAEISRRFRELWSSSPTPPAQLPRPDPGYRSATPPLSPVGDPLPGSLRNCTIPIHRKM